MRKIILAIACTLVASQSFAFKDEAVVRGIETLKARLMLQQPQDRVATMAKFQDFLYKRLNSIPLPEDILKAPANDPRLEEFKSLQEFEGYVQAIQLRPITAENCQKKAVHFANVAKGAGPEAKEAYEILRFLCQ